MDNQELVFVFIPSLVAQLLNAEKLKGKPLTEEEVTRVRDNATVVNMPKSAAEDMIAQRGYDDLSPKQVWPDWCQARKELIPENKA